MAIARPVRTLGLLAVVLWCFFLYQLFKPTASIFGPAGRYANFERDPNLDRKEPPFPVAQKEWPDSVANPLSATGEPEGILVRASSKYAPDAKDTDRIPATLLALVRNSEVDDMVASMNDLERTWNHKFNYPWTFFNDEPFSDEFIKKTSAATKAKCNYGRPE